MPAVHRMVSPAPQRLVYVRYPSSWSWQVVWARHRWWSGCLTRWCTWCTASLTRSWSSSASFTSSPLWLLRWSQGAPSSTAVWSCDCKTRLSLWWISVAGHFSRTLRKGFLSLGVSPVLRAWPWWNDWLFSLLNAWRSPFCLNHYCLSRWEALLAGY